MSKQTVSDVFYIKTKDATTFCIYDLTLSDDCDIISFGYNFTDENPLNKIHYEDEITTIVREQVGEAIKLEMKKHEGLQPNGKY